MTCGEEGDGTDVHCGGSIKYQRALYNPVRCMDKLVSFLLMI